MANGISKCDIATGIEYKKTHLLGIHVQEHLDIKLLYKHVATYFARMSKLKHSYFSKKAF